MSHLASPAPCFQLSSEKWAGQPKINGPKFLLGQNTEPSNFKNFEFKFFCWYFLNEFQKKKRKRTAQEATESKF